MKLNSIFKDRIDRPIEGVIKADDEASLLLELKEYVLTDEVKKRLEDFLEAYNDYTVANGVWISGFFGSGKSHLLKMLAMLLENRQIEGESALEIFLPKCGDDRLFRANLEKAAKLPSLSILFNIDQKADVISKTQLDALLAVFVKVFDEMCGYYGKQGYIAQFERDLDSRGLYEPFKAAFERAAGIPWNKGREQSLLEAMNIARAYGEVSGEDESIATGILDKYRHQYKVSIEDFAAQVQAYIEQQAPGFRLNFFVDEVGQYIADNIKLMTNLQTIAESLATKCRGQAWIIVTAQEDMGTVVGEMAQKQGNDFSKIQARFANRMKLTSADVEEVISKRLLSKNVDGESLLSAIYQAQTNNFRTLFDFADGAPSYKNFKDREDFIGKYPFIPYQFTLFQSAIQNLSSHNAFEGKHSSVGERSMLGVFQEVAIQIRDTEIGRMATFDLMFEGIRTALKSNIQRSIIQAENHLDDIFAIRLLKALFLVKYVKEFKASVRNLRILMQDSFDQDLPALRKKVEEALNLLEQQSYVERNGEFYQFLTDEEKDIEVEIKHTEVETSDVAEELQKIVFDQVIKQRKIRYGENGPDYPYSKKIDDKLHGKEYELAIHVISPLHENADRPDLLQMQNAGKDDLLVLMPPDERLVLDLLMYKRTEKYCRQNTTLIQQEATRRIIESKNALNGERYEEIKRKVQALMGQAKVFVSTQSIDLGSEDGQTRVLNGFQELISRVYPNLQMLRGASYSENDLQKFLKSDNLLALSEAEQEVLAFIQSNQRGGLRTTMKGLVEKFERKPYGWPYAAILCTLAKVCARGKVDLRSDGNLLEGGDLERALRNSHAHGNLVLEPQVEFSASQIRALKEFYEDFFDKPPVASEAKALGHEIGEEFQGLYSELDKMAVQAFQYPFLKALTPTLEKLKFVKSKPYTWFLSELLKESGSLLDQKESLIDPVRKFMNGPQKGIYEDARSFMQANEANFADLDGDEAKLIENTLNDPECFRGNRMQQVKAQLEILREKLKVQLESEVLRAQEKVEALKSRLAGMDEFKALSTEQQAALASRFDEVNSKLTGQSLIAVIRDNLRRFEDKEYPQYLAQMAAWAHPAPAPKPVTNVSQGTSQAVQTIERKEPRVEYLPLRSVHVAFEGAWLANETEVDCYLDAMRQALVEQIRKGKRIQI